MYRQHSRRLASKLYTDDLFIYVYAKISANACAINLERQKTKNNKDF
jgi:hypothetical protein